MSNFIDQTQLFKKLRGLLFAVLYLEVLLDENSATMTSLLLKIENSKLNNFRNFDFCANIHHLTVYLIKAKHRRLFRVWYPLNETFSREVKTLQ